MAENINNYLSLLNNEQREAVKKNFGALLVLAGAGSGKTRVLIFKILHLLKEKMAFPNQILAVTFTNKAALEMKNRVSSLLQYPIDKMWIGTFHSLSAKILRVFVFPYFVINWKALLNRKSPTSTLVLFSHFSLAVGLPLLCLLSSITSSCKSVAV